MSPETIMHVHHALILAAGGVPNPAPAPIPGLTGPLTTIIAWGKWLAIFFGVAGLMVCGVMMIVGRRQRHQTAAEGAAGIPWVIGGLALVSIAAGVVPVFL